MRLVNRVDLTRLYNWLSFLSKNGQRNSETTRNTQTIIVQKPRARQHAATGVALELSEHHKDRQKARSYFHR